MGALAEYAWSLLALRICRIILNALSERVGLLARVELRVLVREADKADKWV